MRRSDTAGPKDNIAIDGLVVPNLCLLCREHHLWVTGTLGGHKAKIVWLDEPIGHWHWQEKAGGGWLGVGPLQITTIPEEYNG